jgi:hypothetical protein
MQRRQFFLVTSGALTAPLAAHVARAKASRPARPRCRGTLLMLTPPAGWQPRSWRDVPPPPFAVVRTVAAAGGGSLAACRVIAKAYNLRQIEAPATWLLVAATDGRLAEGTVNV